MDEIVDDLFLQFMATSQSIEFITIINDILCFIGTLLYDTSH